MSSGVNTQGDFGGLFRGEEMCLTRLKMALLVMLAFVIYVGQASLSFFPRVIVWLICLSLF
jgi:hypothetical protein